ncbi:MAG: RNA polymerase sigma factor [Acidimicrobiia bacterium]
MDGEALDAVRQVFDAALPQVYGYFYGHTAGSRELAEDLTQETFMAAVVRLGRDRDATLSPAWLMAVARNKLVDHFRRQASEARRLERAWERPVESSPEDDPEWDGAANEAAVVAGLSCLPEAQRAALTLHYIDGLAVADVAKVLGRSVHAAESLLARGRSGLKRQLLERDHV